MKPELKIVVSNKPAQALPVEPPPEQVEMPFAMVNGEPMTELPKDLYIPPQALEVFLEAFEGPLDLLLYLIRKQNLDVLDIPIAEITRQYMQYIDVMTELQLELAGEYMVMAATLAEIKSRMLLPRQHAAGDGADEDPRAELVRRLQEYERFKAAAENIDGLERLERDVWSASAELKDRKVVRLIPQVTLQEMLMAFKEVVQRSEMFAHHHIARERLSVRQRMSDILSSLEESSFAEFARLFRPEEGRMGVTVTFVAVLELVREGLIDIVQTEPFAPIHVRPAGPHRGLKLVADNTAGQEVLATVVPAMEIAAPAGGLSDEELAAAVASDTEFDDPDAGKDLAALEAELLSADDELLKADVPATEVEAAPDIVQLESAGLEGALTDESLPEVDVEALALDSLNEIAGADAASHEAVATGEESTAALELSSEARNESAAVANDAALADESGASEALASGNSSNGEDAVAASSAADEANANESGAEGESPDTDERKNADEVSS